MFQGRSKVTSAKVAELRQKKQEAAQAKEFKNLFAIAGAPYEDEGSFAVVKNNFFHVPDDHLVCLGMATCLDNSAAALRKARDENLAFFEHFSTKPRMLRAFNVGRGYPADVNPKFGEELQGHHDGKSWVPFSVEEKEMLDSEKFVEKWVVEDTMESWFGDSKLTRVPPHTDAEGNEVCPSRAFSDVLARNLGAMALHGRSLDDCKLFMRYFMNCTVDAKTGQPVPFLTPDLSNPDSQTKENLKAYETQKSVLRVAMNMVWLISPVPIEPVIGPNGELYAKGSLDDWNWKDDDTPGSLEFDQDTAPQLAIYASLKSDRREGCPNAALHSYVDQLRLWPMPPKAMKDIRHILEKTNLENDFPVVGTLKEYRDSKIMDFAALRKAAVAAFGPMPAVELDGAYTPVPGSDLDKFVTQHAKTPFGPVWLRLRGDDYVNGIKRNGKWVMHPLVYGNALERNCRTFDHLGPEFRYYKPREYEQALREFPSLRTLVEKRRVVLQKSQAIGASKGTKRKADQTTIADLEAALAAANTTAKRAQTSLRASRQDNERMLEQLDKANYDLSKPYKTINDGTTFQVVFDERDSKLMLRPLNGSIVINGQTFPTDENGCVTVRYFNSTVDELPDGALPDGAL